MAQSPIEDFLAEQQERGLSPATLKAKRSDLKKFVAWWEDELSRPFTLEQLVARDVRRWQHYCETADAELRAWQRQKGSRFR